MFSALIDCLIERGKLTRNCIFSYYYARNTILYIRLFIVSNNSNGVLIDESQVEVNVIFSRYCGNLKLKKLSSYVKFSYSFQRPLTAFSTCFYQMKFYVFISCSTLQYFFPIFSCRWILKLPRAAAIFSALSSFR